METRNPVLGELERIVARNLLKYAVGQAHAFGCPHCGDTLDAGRAVLVTGPDCQWFGCAKCHGQGAHTWNDGKWSVYDGRTLFAESRRHGSGAPRSNRAVKRTPRLNGRKRRSA